MIARVFTCRVGVLSLAFFSCLTAVGEELKNPGSTLSPTPASVSSGKVEEFDLGMDQLPELTETPPLSGGLWSPDKLVPEPSPQGGWDSMFKVGLDGTIEKKSGDVFLGKQEPATSIAAAAFSDVDKLDNELVGSVSEASTLSYTVTVDTENKPAAAAPVTYSEGTSSGLTRRLLLWGGFAAVFAIGCLLVGGALSSRSAPPPPTPSM